MLDDAVAAVELARRHVDDVEFSAEDGARTDPDFLEQISQGGGRRRRPHRQHSRHGRLLDAGRIRRADRPHRARRSAIRAIVSVHCHDDLGLAVANSLAAVQNGARQIECTINGIGERAGNCSLEEIVMAIKTRTDRLPYPHRHPHRAPLSGQPVAVELDHQLRAATQQGHRGRERVRARGRHPSGRLPEGTSTYEIIDPKTVGVPESKLVLGKHSGRHALNERCEDLGFDLSQEELDAVYQRFTAAADRKKG